MRTISILVTVALAAILPGTAPASPAAAGAEVVACKLPPQLRSLGRNATYLAAGRVVHVPVSECKLRGGTWSGGGPGAYAGGGSGNGPLAVTVGSEDAKAAACPLKAVVAGLKAGSTLSVRAGPATSFARVDRLANGTHVHLCDQSGASGWVGIIYGPGDCGLAAPISPPRAYDGACRSGWVHTDYLR